ncbi:MAG: hypothetical protein NTU81_03530 [Candidatus Nomurabacteria bacterium]|nr:hypothetical protein [Candidatus Nomurabacteria bacterium]
MSINFKKIKRNSVRVLLFGFALTGFVFFVVFISMQFGWLNVKGSVSERNSYFNVNKNSQKNSSTDSNLEIICKINVLSKFAPLTSVNISKTMTNGANDELLNKMIEMASLRFKNDYLYNLSIEKCKTSSDLNQQLNIPISAYYWADTDQWNLMKEVFTRDKETIKRAAHDSGISPRIILSGVIGEQFRFFNNSKREIFKSYFEPMKILASLSQISFGIAGLKPKTVATIESNLKDVNSEFYLGPDMEHVADYPPNVDVDSERLSRITNAKYPYYSYLYSGLYMKEIIAQWQKKGYNLNERPEILATLYNLGFFYSVPKDNPEIGGSIININNVDYTFGDIAYEFYYSGELSDIYPIGVQ